MADRETLKLREGGNRNCCLEISRLFSRARKQKKPTSTNGFLLKVLENSNRFSICLYRRQRTIYKEI